MCNVRVVSICNDPEVGKVLREKTLWPIHFIARLCGSVIICGLLLMYTPERGADPLSYAQSVLLGRGLRACVKRRELCRSRCCEDDLGVHVQR